MYRSSSIFLTIVALTLFLMVLVVIAQPTTLPPDVEKNLGDLAKETMDNVKQGVDNIKQNVDQMATDLSGKLDQAKGAISSAQTVSFYWMTIFATILTTSITFIVNH